MHDGAWRRFANAGAAALAYPGIAAGVIEGLIASPGVAHSAIEARRSTAVPTTVTDLTSPSSSPASKKQGDVIDLASPPPRPGSRRKSPGRRAASPASLKEPGLKSKMRSPRSA